jgi:hypothetical protein
VPMRHVPRHSHRKFDRANEPEYDASTMRRCPRCSLISPDQSLRCQCGFDFTVDDRREIPRERDRWRAEATRTLWIGFAIATAGVIFTVAGYAGAREDGGSFLIFTA